MSYTDQSWFKLLETACESKARKDVATLLGVSPSVITQVLNATGKYGTGQASTERLADRVVHTFGLYPCPHLTEQAAEADRPVVITADECRAYAHRKPPTASPRDMQHWQACQVCKHRAASAPPEPREVKPRKHRVIAVATAQRDLLE
jgi:hypothetical protein